MNCAKKMVKHQKKPKSNQRGQIADLRTSSYNKAHAFQSSYGPKSACHQTSKEPNPQIRFDDVNPKIKKSEFLPNRTQATFVSAAYTAMEDGNPLNAILTVSWSKLGESPNSFWFNLHPYDRAKALVEKIRKYLTRAKRRSPVAYIWVREAVSASDEHFHIAFHLPKVHRKDFISFMGRLLGKPPLQYRRPPTERSKGEIACSADGGWHLGIEVSDVSPEFSGYWLAAYLAKAEPSQRVFRGRVINNTNKTERGTSFGGRIRGDKYDIGQGTIEGNLYRRGRFSISRSLRP